LLFPYASGLKPYAGGFKRLIPQDFFTFASLGSVPTPSGRVPGFGSLASGHFPTASEGAAFPAVYQDSDWAKAQFGSRQLLAVSLNLRKHVCPEHVF
jgi:hypothetical protein